MSSRNWFAVALLQDRQRCCRSIRGEVQLVRLDQILGLAPGAVDLLVEPTRRALEVGDDEAAVASPGRGLDAGDHLPLGRPGLWRRSGTCRSGGPCRSCRRSGPSQHPRQDRRPSSAGPDCRRGRRRSRPGCAPAKPLPRAGCNGCRRGSGYRRRANGCGWRARRAGGRARPRPRRASCPGAGSPPPACRWSPRRCGWAGNSGCRSGHGTARVAGAPWTRSSVSPMSSTIRRGTSVKLSQNSSTIAAIMRLSAVDPGRFSSRHMVGCEHSSAPLSGSRPTAILNAGSARNASQSLASS